VTIADEESLTNALIRLAQGKKHEIYWSTGHGERTFRGSEPESLSALHESLTHQDFRFTEWHLAREDIPENASLVVVAAPEKALLAAETENLTRYLNRGGRIIVFLEPFTDAGLKDFLESYGIVIAPDVVVDKLSRVMGGDYLLPMVADYGFHEITRDFRLTSFFYVARSVEKKDETRTEITVTPLATTSENSWAETDQGALEEGRAVFDGQDRKGPISLSVIAELEAPIQSQDLGDTEAPGSTQITGRGRLVVFGDIDFATNRFYNFSGNGDLITNTLQYLVGREDLITIQKKHAPVQALMLTRGQGQLLFWVSIVLMPLMVLGTGIAVWHRRRSR
jgi:ABC-type uncharacterized transport system involved in gliding motility auxiliary subunit